LHAGNVLTPAPDSVQQVSEAVASCASVSSQEAKRLRDTAHPDRPTTWSDSANHPFGRIRHAAVAAFTRVLSKAISAAGSDRSLLQHTAARVADRDRFLAANRRVQCRAPSVHREEVERLIAGRLTMSEVPPKKWTSFSAALQATDELLATAECCRIIRRLFTPKFTPTAVLLENGVPQRRHVSQRDAELRDFFSSDGNSPPSHPPLLWPKQRF